MAQRPSEFYHEGKLNKLNKEFLHKEEMNKGTGKLRKVAEGTATKAEGKGAVVLMAT